jgi:hypothetical protein
MDVLNIMRKGTNMNVRKQFYIYISDEEILTTNEHNYNKNVF